MPREGTWANSKVLDVAAGLREDALRAEAPGTRDAVLGTLAHLARVEDVYLATIELRL